MLDSASSFVRDFLVQFTFVPDVPMTVVTECRKKGYAFTLMNRPFGGERQHPVCTIPFEGAFRDNVAFRNAQERRFAELGAKVIRTRVLSQLVLDGKKNGGGFLYDEAELTIAIADKQIPDLVGFMRELPRGAIYRDLLMERDDGLQTWNIVLRSTDITDRMSAGAVQLARCLSVFKTVRHSFHRVHTDNNKELDKGWL